MLTATSPHKIVPTDADIKHRWITSRRWISKDGVSTGDPDVLSVECVRNKPSSSRRYFGWQVSVYYEQQLQDVRAEPERLLELFPPPAVVASP